LKLPAIDDAYKRRSIQELLSLKGKTTVITGGGRGIGLALARGCVEVGGNVAVLDALSEPHPDFKEMQTEFPDSQIQYYRQAN
jgi:sorbose reductase